MTGSAPASAVARTVRSGLLALAAVRGAESCLLGLAGLALTLAAAVFSGAALADPAALVVALAGGVAAGAVWWLEHRLRAEHVARLLDRELGQGGALLTAFEVERAGTPSAVARALVERAGAGLRGAHAVKRVLPSSALPIAAPFVAVLVLALANERARAPASPENARRLTSELVRGIGTARELAVGEAGAGELALAAVPELIALHTEALELEGALAEGRADPGEAVAVLAELEQGLARLAAETPAVGALARAVAEARAAAGAARSELGAGGPPDGTATGAEALGAEVPAGSSDGTMSRSPASDTEPGSTGAESGRAATAGAPEHGAVVSGSVPPEYEGVVQRWLAASSPDSPERAP